MVWCFEFVLAFESDDPVWFGLLACRELSVVYWLVATCGLLAVVLQSLCGLLAK